LKDLSRTLASKVSDKKLASQTIGSVGDYSFMLAHREGTGDAEYHATKADVFVVQSGEATLVVGGELVDGKSTRPNEMYAASIKGGTEKKLAAGDVVTIPAKVAHQLKLDPGKEFTYFVVKIAQP
jgi:mannose-6-phosphate isomerase-like protein (cupin superfamily)